MGSLCQADVIAHVPEYIAHSLLEPAGGDEMHIGEISPQMRPEFIETDVRIINIKAPQPRHFEGDGGAMSPVIDVIVKPITAARA